MIIYPAIDLKDGQCVRLLRGEMEKATVFSNQPSEQAKAFEDAGFEWLHLVDLNGAFEGRPVNQAAVKEILAAIDMPVQLGGGIRSLQLVETWLEAGVTRVILGTAALRNPEFVREACRLFPGQVAVGIDAKNGKVAVSGWAEITDITALELALRFEDVGIAAIIYTDIHRDGAMEGPNLDETVKLAEALSTPVIVSGGVSKIADVHAISAKACSGIGGMIIGRALYEKSILLHELEPFL